MGWITENVYMPFSYLVVERTQWVMREDFAIQNFFFFSLSPSLSLVLCSKPIWPEIMEKKRDSLCSMQQTVYL